jgi:hypothetical protein
MLGHNSAPQHDTSTLHSTDPHRNRASPDSTTPIPYTTNLHMAVTELPLTGPSETETIHYLTQPYHNCTDLHHNIVSRDSTIPIQPRTIYGYTSPVHPRTIHRSTLLNQHDTLHHGSIRYVTIPHQHHALLTYT